ncbi:EAL domain-containing protein [Oceanicoccus sp. KOV_DT_Chl]|uniref:EAL domain-containing response regulator n=1 Tax=Oceanicoccus sp. KOV_DT_Chl TaxID=1904639 RepID=UPI000C7DDBFE|nr:EAL domain-containing protein [Oceanicoccus sp. KOV_DT_Chl]
MARKSTIKLLLINESDNEGERLVSLFRNAGRVTRVHRATSPEDLHSTLEKDHWDLLIANDKHPEIAVEQCLEQLAKLSLDLPAIVIRDDNIEAALEAGATDVISSEQDQHLIHSALRELRNLEQRRELASTLDKLSDAEARSELLLSESQDAIAYVADGMLVSCNDVFGERFGYDSIDDLDCAPVVDLISDADQDKFKGLLKTQINNGSGSTDFSFTAIKKSGENFTAVMQLSCAVFDDEDCIQLSIKEHSSNASSQTVANFDRDPATGLYSHDYFLSQLDSSNKQAAAGTGQAVLLFIGIDKFTALRSRFGITQAHNIVLDIANFIQQHSDNVSCLAHFCDDGFTMLIEDSSTDKTKKYADDLCSKFAQHIIEIDGQSLQCTASIGLLDINGQLQRDANDLIDLVFNTAESLRDEDGTGNSAEVHIPVREKKTLGDSSNDDELDSFLEEALEDSRFTLNFQPVVSLRGSSGGDHYEVTTTMLGEDGEALHANQFLQNMNFGGVNTRLDRWIILEATKQLASELEQNHATHLFINLTANALQDESLIPWLGVALKAGGITPGSLILQFLETDITNYLKPAKIFSDAIGELGCKLSISGFGKADDPFKILQQVHASHVKIAAEFAQALQNGGDTQSLKAMVSSIGEEDAKAIISGVENAAALAQLWQIGVDYIQGSYMAAPSKKMDYEFTDIA